MRVLYTRLWGVCEWGGEVGADGSEFAASKRGTE